MSAQRKHCANRVSITHQNVEDINDYSLENIPVFFSDETGLELEPGQNDVGQKTYKHWT